MAIKFKDAQAALTDGPITEMEAKALDIVETYIDAIIRDNFDGKKVHIRMDIVDFSYTPSGDMIVNIKDARKKLLKNTLLKRYTDVGWKTSTYTTEDDGPNRPGRDYLVLAGK